MTNSEWALCQNIIKSYSMGQANGEVLFTDLFVSNDQGMIVLLKPPSKRQTSLEVFLFLMSLMQQQQMRNMESVMIDMANQLKAKMAEIDEKLASFRAK
jgi:hypothetical protein